MKTEEHEHDFYAEYTELYDKRVHDNFEDVCKPMILMKTKIKELKVLAEVYND